MSEVTDSILHQDFGSLVIDDDNDDNDDNDDIQVDSLQEEVVAARPGVERTTVATTTTTTTTTTPLDTVLPVLEDPQGLASSLPLAGTALATAVAIVAALLFVFRSSSSSSKRSTDQSKGNRSRSLSSLSEFSNARGTTTTMSTNDTKRHTDYYNGEVCLKAQRCVQQCIQRYSCPCPWTIQRAAEYARKQVQQLSVESRLFAVQSQLFSPTNNDVDHSRDRHGNHDDRLLSDKFLASSSSLFFSPDDDDDNNDGLMGSLAGSPPQPIVVRQIQPQHIRLMEELGMGGFSFVHRCQVHESGKAEVDQHEYAIKFLQQEVLLEKEQFRHGWADLALEAHFLYILDHPHIIQLHGVRAPPRSASLMGMFQSPTVYKGTKHGPNMETVGFFLLVDRLHDTLDDRIDHWRRHDQQIAKGTLPPDSEDQLHAKLMERCEIAKSIANALEYLHSHQIVYRDLKPDNMGFDESGTLKLFDFGLAKELKPRSLAKNHPDDGYLLTGNTGSRRYMAPEVALNKPYNTSVDVYSFGILLWEVCAARRPFVTLNVTRHQELVVKGGQRPSLTAPFTSHWPVSLQWLMQKCWAPNSKQRPSCTAIQKVLRDILNSNDEIPAEWLAEAAQSSRLGVGLLKQAWTSARKAGHVVSTSTSSVVGGVSGGVANVTRKMVRRASVDLFRGGVGGGSHTRGGGVGDHSSSGVGGGGGNHSSAGHSTASGETGSVGVSGGGVANVARNMGRRASVDLFRGGSGGGHTRGGTGDHSSSGGGGGSLSSAGHASAGGETGSVGSGLSWGKLGRRASTGGGPTNNMVSMGKPRQVGRAVSTSGAETAPYMQEQGGGAKRSRTWGLGTRR